MNRCNFHNREENDNDRRDEDWENNRNNNGRQRHVHEFTGSTRLAELEEDPHNHRFAGVSGQAIPHNGSHIHEIQTRTDFFDHFHNIRVFSGPAIHVGDRKHVHFVTGRTQIEDGHNHEFRFATLIESPIFEER